MQMLHLKEVCWMNPWAMVEGIPADAQWISIYILHIYGQSFSFDKGTCIIELAALPDNADENPEFEAVKKVSWPLEDYRQ